MKKLWDGAEFFRMMIANERATSDFYRMLAEDSTVGNEFFAQMAKDEDRHEMIFSKLLERFEKSDRFKVEVDPEHQEFLDVLMKDVIENDQRLKLEKHTPVKSAWDVLSIAKSIEKNSVMMVQEIKNIYPDVSPEDIDIVLNEEKKHLKLVTKHQLESLIGKFKV